MSLNPSPAAFITAQAQQNTFSQRVKRFAVYIFWLILYLAWVIMMGQLLIRIPGPRNESFSLFFLLFLPFAFVLAYYLTILVHELGHVLAGWLVNFRFLMLIVGPFKVLKGSRGLQLVYSGFRANQFQGRALLIPTEAYDLRRRYLWLFAGGPLATLFQVFILLGLRYLLRGVVIPFAVEQLLFWLSLISLLLLPTTMLPMRIQGLYTDGAYIRSFLFDPARTTYLLAQIRLSVISIAGTRPRELDPVLLQDLTACASGPIEKITAHLLAYRHALDQTDLALAPLNLENCLAQLLNMPPNLFGVGIFIEAAYYEAHHYRDATTAHAWLDLARKLYKNNQWPELQPMLRRAEAAILLAENQPAEASLKAREGLIFLEQSYDRGYVQAETVWLEALVAQAQLTVPAGEIAILPLAKPQRPANARPITRAILGTLFYSTIFLVIGLMIGTLSNTSLRCQLISFYYTATGNPSKAMEYLSQGITDLGQDRGAASLYYRRGQIYYQQEQFEQAVSDFTQAIRLKPDASYYAYRGITYYQLGNYKLAIPDLSLCLQSSEPAPKQRIDLLLYRGTAYYWESEYDLAKADYEQVLTLSTDPIQQEQIKSRMRKYGLY